ncbi:MULTISPECIES: succinylglutamate desuccinylase/aspartoacylase family protein [Gammaproteobacteria]|uniref:succinylglutamate desuccinylase/aspartoacylase family protein n=1 Tax=Gammaproteobacteria TaxID=1236 RepID=UPI000DD060BA|nr:MULTISPECIES: succinylglutamate desuccinylase/aspartoacylase family protein [Gammaproteobacteria]RTE86237.1 succinylglutamate desuccinylase/aspartoacylase family protein [Aliidiomarina sp. B3213]TCZ91588.1 succinylglutamate desuccinylase/aspartoacylase family protein [Lysobacter sp. N42]
MAKVRQQPYELAEHTIQPGTRCAIHLPAARLYNDTALDLHVEVFHGVKPGPTLLVCAAIHGDELNGIEICRRLMDVIDPGQLAGTLLVVPVVNMFGFIQRSRYLPDRRDLNRCFPGSERGALGSRLAHIINTSLVERATHIIDLHTGAVHRSNLPQIRVNVESEIAVQMAEAFNSPVILNSKNVEGTLRSQCSELGIPLILYEAGEALRFDFAAIRAGLNGVTNVMKMLKMMKGRRTRKKVTPVFAQRSVWVRSESDGLVLSRVELGQSVSRNQILAEVVAPHESETTVITSPVTGIIIGISNIPIANEGEALFNIACFDKSEIPTASEMVDTFVEAYPTDPL